MLDPKTVFDILKANGVRFFTGVPDTYLNAFVDYALEHEENLIAANEGNAVSIAAGHYLATREIPLVYMQNSGLNNALDPLGSLADPIVYGTPMLLLVGWRGQGDTEPFHPQHTVQGHLTPTLLSLFGIPYTILSDDMADFEEAVRIGIRHCKRNRSAYALVVPKGVMSHKVKPNITDVEYPMCREEAIETILDHMPEDTIYSATTGRATRELFFLRERRGQDLRHDFLNVGSMGHASSVALGMAISRPERSVVVLDGDGAAIMHMGSFCIAGNARAPKFLHVVLNNGSHESVGCQPSVGHEVDFTTIAEGAGYKTVGHAVTTKEELIEAVEALRDCGHPAFIDCRVHKGLRGELPFIHFDHRAAINSLIDELNGTEEEN